MIKAEITDLGVKVELEKENIKIYKYLSHNSFAQALLNNTGINTGILPPGTLAYKQQGNQIKIAMVVPESIQEVTYDARDGKKISTYEVPTPHLLWIFKFKLDNTYERGIVYALKNLDISNNMDIYKFPFSNVSDYVCWGEQMKMEGKKFESLYGLSSLPALFYKLTFNTDLDGNVERSKLFTIPQIKKWYDEAGHPETENWSATQILFKALNKEKQFPYDCLYCIGKFENVF